MAKVIIDNIEYEVADGAKIRACCEEAGVSFSCNTGVCGECEIEVLEGIENLNEFQPEEDELGLELPRRLACLCVVKQGIVKVKTI